MNTTVKNHYNNWCKCSISVSFLDYIRTKMQTAIDKKQYQLYSDLLEVENYAINC